MSYNPGLDSEGSQSYGSNASHAGPLRNAPTPDPAASDDAIGGWDAAAVAGRIRRLIARQDGGDVCAAAHRLRVTVPHLIQLEHLLGEQADTATLSRAAEDLLTAVVLRYQVDATWLLTGTERPRMSELPAPMRRWLADFLFVVGNRVIDEYRARAAGGEGSIGDQT
jgi:hypothetical protein